MSISRKFIQKILGTVTGYPVITKFVQTCPEACGIYKMIARDGAVLYVGKANNLKSRLDSYARSGDLSNKTLSMIQQIAHIEITKTDNENAALILESELIKQLKPKYNIALRDDKSFPYICITKSHKFPRVCGHRGKQNPSNAYFGPFTSPRKMHRVIADVQKNFKLRSCTDSFFSRTPRPCILYQINRCTAPCVAKISAAAYSKFVDGTEDFLSQKLEDLQAESPHDFTSINLGQTTDDISHKLDALQSLFGLAHPINRIEIYDNSHIHGAHAIGVMVVFDRAHGFNKSQYRKFNIRFDLTDRPNKNDDYYMLREVLTRRLKHTELSTPDLMIIDGGLQHLSVARGVCSSKLSETFIIGIAKGKHRNSGNEIIYTCDGRKLDIDRSDSTKHFLQVLRDEAHRFAISSHRYARSKIYKTRLSD